MLWLYLLGAVTVLVIAVRRLTHKLKPLDDELYSSKVAIDHVHSGVAWIRADGTIQSLNPSLAGSLGAQSADLVGHDWLMLFPTKERAKVKEAYSQALLLGIAAIDTIMERTDGSPAYMNLMMVSVHDHKMRFVGHHCLTVDRTRERGLEDTVKRLTAELAQYHAAELAKLSAAVQDSSAQEHIEQRQ